MGVVIRQSVKGAAINYIGAFIGFITTMFLVTKLLNPEDIGLTKVIYEVGSLFASLALLGTSSSIMRFFPYFRDKEKRHNGFFFYIVTLPFLGLILFISVYLLLKEPIITFFGKNSSLFQSYFYWIIPLIFFLTYWSVFEAYSNANMRIVIPKFIREVLVRILLMAVYVLYGFHVINRDGFVGSYILVYALATLAAFIYIAKIAPVSLKHDNAFVSKPLRKDIAKYTLFLMAGTLGSTMLAKLDIFMISSELGFSSAGIYTIVFYMATIIDIPSRSINAISAPIAASELKEGNFEQANQLYKKVSLHQLLIGSLLFVLIWINIDSIFTIIPNGEIYMQGKWVVFFIGLAKLVEITLNFGGTLISFSRYYHWSLYIVFIIMGLGILTNYLLIPYLGISGAAIATLISTILSYSFQQFIVLKKIKGNPYSKGTLKTLILIVILFGLNVLLPALNNHWIDLIYRSTIICVIAFLYVYFFHISDEFNSIVNSFIKKIGNK